MLAFIKFCKEILELLESDKKKLPLLVLMFLASSLLDVAGIGLIGPYANLVFTPNTIDDGRFFKLIQAINLPTEHDDLLLALGYILLGIFVLKLIAAVAIQGVILRFVANQRIRLQSRLMQTYQKMQYTTYIERNSSEYVFNIQNLAGQFAGSVVLPSLRTISDGIVSLAILVMLALNNAAALVLLLVLFGSLVIIYDWVFRAKLKAYGISANESATHMVQAINESIRGLKEIRVLGVEKYFHNAVKSNCEQYSQATFKSQLIAVLPRYFVELLLVVFVVVLVVVFVSIYQSPAKLAATLAIFGVAALRLVPTVNIVSASLAQIRFSRNGVGRLHRDLCLNNVLQETVENTVSRNPETVGFEHLVVRSVQFKYPGAKVRSLNKIDLDIRAGESIGLFGPSGSGKTTLVDVLLGLLVPDEGTLRFNGEDLHLHLHSWRSQVAYLPQDVFIIDDSLRRNVALGQSDSMVDDCRLSKALIQAQLSELVDDLPDGVNTILGESGVRVSGGQRQRIALARAFYHGRSVLVMDESTSSLDNEVETQIVSTLKNLKGKKTFIVIAHRLGTLEHCDRIYFLENGNTASSETFSPLK